MGAIADERMADAGEVDADLVRAAGLEPAADDRRSGHRLDRRDVGDRAAAIDRTIDRLRRDLTDRDGAVLAIDVVQLERIAELLVRLAGAREHEQAARRQIEPVHEIHLAELRAELIEQIAAARLGRRRGDQAGGLLDDDDRVVGEHDPRLGRRFGSLERATDVDLDLLSRLDRPSRHLHARPIDEHAAEIDHRTRLAPRQPGHVLGDHLIEAQPRVVGRDLERVLHHAEATSTIAVASSSGTSSCRKCPAPVRTTFASGRSRDA